MAGYDRLRRGPFRQPTPANLPGLLEIAGTVYLRKIDGTLIAIDGTGLPAGWEQAGNPANVDTNSGNIDFAGGRAVSVLLYGSALAAALDANTYHIQNLPLPIQDGDAANKEYVDDSVSVPTLAQVLVEGNVMGVNPIANTSNGSFGFQGGAAGDPQIRADNKVFLEFAAAARRIMFSANLPANGNLVPGDLSLYFDATNGAPVLNFKAKTLDGTVVTSVIPQSAVTDLGATLAALQAIADKNAANGYAGLDGNAKLPLARSQAATGFYSGNNVSIANGATGFLTVDALSSGTGLLNIATPDTPVFIAAGLYSVTVCIRGAALTAGGLFQGMISDISVQKNDSRPSTVAVPTVLSSFGTVVKVAAGQDFQISVRNFDGVAARDFDVEELVISRIA